MRRAHLQPMVFGTHTVADGDSSIRDGESVD
jgi:hypothetical protein